MDNNKKTYFLGKHVPKCKGHIINKSKQMDYCIASILNVHGKLGLCVVRDDKLQCKKCLFDKSGKREFKIWIINQRLISSEK